MTNDRFNLARIYESQQDEVDPDVDSTIFSNDDKNICGYHEPKHLVDHIKQSVASDNKHMHSYMHLNSLISYVISNLMNFLLIILELARCFVVIMTNVLACLVIMISFLDIENPLMTIEVVLLFVLRKLSITKFAMICLLSSPTFMNLYL